MDTPSSDQVLYQIMLNGMEESPLYEILSELEKVLPIVSLEKRLKIAQQGLAELLGRQWLELWQAEWPDKNSLPVPQENISAALEAVRSWTAPTSEERLYFYIQPTQLGTQEWTNGGWNGK